MMQKDEHLLLEPWLRYHGYLFGYENLFVFDNGSLKDETLSILQRFERVGVNVDYSRSSGEDFDHKGVIVGDKIREFQSSDTYDLVFPIDCDEFVALIDLKGISISRYDILEYLSNFAHPGPMVKVGHCLDNRPGSLELFRLTSFNKTIIPIGSFHDIDHGFHEGKSKLHTNYKLSNIVYIHLHYKPFDIVKKHALDKLKPFVNIDSVEEIGAFKGVGRHLTRFFFMDEEEYYVSTGDYVYPVVKYIRFKEFIEHLMYLKPFMAVWTNVPSLSPISREKILNAEVVDMSDYFDVESYVIANPDVGRSEMNPTIHYCLFGFRENRPKSLKEADRCDES